MLTAEQWVKKFSVRQSAQVSTSALPPVSAHDLRGVGDSYTVPKRKSATAPDGGRPEPLSLPAPAAAKCALLLDPYTNVPMVEPVMLGDGSLVDRLTAEQLALQSTDVVVLAPDKSLAASARSIAVKLSKADSGLSQEELEHVHRLFKSSDAQAAERNSGIFHSPAERLSGLRAMVWTEQQTQDDHSDDALFNLRPDIFARMQLLSPGESACVVEALRRAGAIPRVGPTGWFSGNPQAWATAPGLPKLTRRQAYFVGQIVALLHEESVARRPAWCEATELRRDLAKVKTARSKLSTAAKARLDRAMAAATNRLLERLSICIETMRQVAPTAPATQPTGLLDPSLQRRRSESDVSALIDGARASVCKDPINYEPFKRAVVCNDGWTYEFNALPDVGIHDREPLRPVALHRTVSNAASLRYGRKFDDSGVRMYRPAKLQMPRAISPDEASRRSSLEASADAVKATPAPQASAESSDEAFLFYQRRPRRSGQIDADSFSIHGFSFDNLLSPVESERLVAFLQNRGVLLDTPYPRSVGSLMGLEQALSEYCKAAPAVVGAAKLQRVRIRLRVFFDESARRRPLVALARSLAAELGEGADEGVREQLADVEKQLAQLPSGDVAAAPQGKTLYALPRMPSLLGRFFS